MERKSTYWGLGSGKSGQNSVASLAHSTDGRYFSRFASISVADAAIENRYDRVKTGGSISPFNSLMEGEWVSQPSSD